MKNQSTLEFVVLLAGIVAVAIFVSVYFYGGASNLNTNLVNLTKSQFNVFSMNLYSSANGNYIYGSYYQTGNYTYSGATLEISVNSISYSVPIITTYYKSTMGNYLFYFNSTTAPQSLISSLENSNVPYVFEFIKFKYDNHNYMFIANQTEQSKAN